jgi:hypothetical protein
VCVCLAAIATLAAAPRSQSADPFAFLAPTVSVSTSDRARIDRGETVVRILPEHDQDVAVLAIVQTSMSAERLVEWSRDVERLKDTPQVQRVHKLDGAPDAADFAALDLPADDLKDIRSCRPGDCAVKLTADEMSRFRVAMAGAGANWMSRAAEVFRDVALDRARTYLAGDHAALAPYADGHGEPSRATAFSALLADSAYVQRLPTLRAFLTHPRADRPGLESFVYWSIEQFGAKPVVSMTHTGIVVRDGEQGPDVLVAGKQIFATHYTAASLNITSLVRQGGRGYLVVYNRSTTDTIGGIFGGITRRVIEGRIRREAAELIDSTKRRIEAGPPRRAAP